MQQHRWRESQHPRLGIYHFGANLAISHHGLMPPLTCIIHCLGNYPVITFISCLYHRLEQTT